jgi:molybdopterin-guanine dinucleotide biosynthesis protein
MKSAGQGTIVIASGRRGRGFKSRHPDAKTAGQRLDAIESRWPRVTNCVIIESFSDGVSLALKRSRRSDRLPVAAWVSATREN